ncbi:hypothetical protein [Mesoplasma photuris]|uniref:hypothetical protein n=1 Tax=Mesoplasma photuris TaxID=217731 RepID=UPI0004E19BBD|nr:hypothetical protein [Mesoplasma photuris]
MKRNKIELILSIIVVATFVTMFVLNWYKIIGIFNGGIIQPKIEVGQYISTIDKETINHNRFIYEVLNNTSAKPEYINIKSQKDKSVKLNFKYKQISYNWVYSFNYL